MGEQTGMSARIAGQRNPVAEGGTPPVIDAAFARWLADRAGQVLLQVRAEMGHSDGNALKAAGDKAAHDLLRTELARWRPADAVLSEEDDHARLAWQDGERATVRPERLGASRVWIVDPLDGTREFSEEGRTDWAVHVALWPRTAPARAAWPPARWRCRPSTGRSPPTTPPAYPPLPLEAATGGPIRLAASRTRPPAFVTALAEDIGAELVPMGSAGVKIAAVINGEVDAYVHAGGQYEWDSAAPVAVASATGPARFPDRRLCAELQPGRPEAARSGGLPHGSRAPTACSAAASPAGNLSRELARPTPERSGHIPMSQTKPYRVSHLDALEAESIFVMREVVAEFERPVLLFSGGKDSIVMLRLAEKAFAPARDPVPGDARRHRPQLPRGAGVPRHAGSPSSACSLIVASVQEAIDSGLVREPPDGTRNRIQTPVLLDAVEKYRFDALFGGARRDEEKARAKERMFSFRDEFGQWDPKNQRPELWSLYNGRHPPRRVASGSSRCPTGPSWTSGTTSPRSGIALPSIYFAHEREVFERDGMLYAVNEFCRPGPARRRHVAAGALPHGRRRRPDRRGALRRRHGREGDRRGRRHPDHRARRHPRRRQGQRGRDGRPQAGGVLLMSQAVLEPDAAARSMDLLRFATAGSVDDGKSHADRPAALRHQVDLRRPARGGRGGQRGPRRRVHQPRAAHRRPARRAGAGHHDRRGVPLLRHAAAQVHHRRHPGAHPVHPEHGHRRLHRRPGADPGRRPQGPGRAVPPARVPRARCCGCRTWCSCVNKMDLVDYVAGRSSSGSPTSSPRSRPSSTSPT